MGYTNDTEQAKDLVQETFISVWKGLPGFRNESQVGTWIFRIATNLCLRAREVAKRMPKTELSFHLTETWEESPEEKLSFLYRCIAELEATERIIISLELEGLPQAEIAAVIGLSSTDLPRHIVVFGSPSCFQAGCSKIRCHPAKIGNLIKST